MSKKDQKADKKIKGEEYLREYWEKQRKANSKTWYLSGYYNDTMPGGGMRHPLDMD